MQLNNEYRFGIAPTVTTPRSTFTMHQNIRTTFNAGSLIPFYVDPDVMPGDTFKVKGTFVVRQSTPIYPTMDNSFLDVAFFFVPHRLVWNHWKAFWGENETGAWTMDTEYEVPQIVVGQTNTSALNEKGDILQYMGLPIQTEASTNGFQVSALPYRAYQKIFNDWWRDENYCAPMAINTGDSTSYIQADNVAPQWGGAYDETNNTKLTKRCAPVFKFKDMLNAVLPEPQKGDPITLPIGESAPIGFNIPKASEITPENATITYRNLNYTNPPTEFTISTIGTEANKGYLETTDGPQDPIVIDNHKYLYADLTNAVAATINAQRFAFAAQRILEQKARTGTRYIEIIKGFFGVNSPDARQQRSELLGFKRIPITMNQVAQTSSTDSTSPQGNVSAYSLTVDSDQMFHKSFTEHGTILGVLCVRQEHSYDTGIAKFWRRKRILDFYHPQMAFLGEEAVLNEEIFATGEAQDKETFGFNERWYDMRYKNNINTGAFSTKYAQSLDSWHYGDSYKTLPVASFEWRKETKEYIDRTLAVTSEVEDQYIMDSRLEFVATRCLPMYSIPGLMDHF